MLLSVITVNYNNIAGLRETRASVLSQTFRDFEWIVVDAGSTDGASAFLEAVSDPRLRWISERDGGIFHGMNKGIRLATGRYCIFMNSGDTFANSEVLSRTHDLLSCNAYDTIYGEFSEKADERLFFKRARPPFFNFYSMFTHHQSIFYRTSLLEAGYDLSYRYSADWALTTNLLSSRNTSSSHAGIAISIFARGGISQRGEQRRRIDEEHWKILRKEARLAPPVAASLWLAKTSMNKLRAHLPRLYDWCRFR